MTIILKKILLLLPIPIVVLSTTWLVDPANIKNDSSYETGIASILLSGMNVANLVNYKERKLQQKVIQGLSTSPDVIVLGSSRSMQINSTFFPGQTFLNNSVSGASIEDDIGIFDLYRKRDLKPTLVVIGLDPWVLNRNNGQNRWEDLYDEYFEMKSILGIASSLERAIQENLLFKIRNYINYKEFISPAYFNQSFIDLIQNERTVKKYWATDKMEADEPIKMSDGSRIYDKKMREKSLADINSDAKAFAITSPMYSLGEFKELDKSTMLLLDSFIAYLQKNNIKVLIFLPPYHPTAYAVIKENSAYSMVKESEKWYLSLANKYKVILVGSFDPKISSSEESDFFDGMHPKSHAVHRIFNKLSR